MNLIHALKSILDYAKQKNRQNQFRPISQKELIERAKLALDDISAGRTTSQSDLEDESANW